MKTCTAYGKEALEAKVGTGVEGEELPSLAGCVGDGSKIGEGRTSV
jgi:hypothetical protein